MGNYTKKKENDEHLERNEITGLRLHSRAKHALAMSLLGNGTFSAEAPFVKEPIVIPFGCPIWFDITEALLMILLCVCP